MRVLGIDWGEKRVGVAVADTQAPVAVPRETLKQNKKLVQNISALAKNERVEAIVVGLPLTMEGEERKTARQVREFSAALASDSGLAIHLVDERLSSEQVRRKPARADARPDRSRAKDTRDIDAAAAAAILQSWLDRNRKK